MGLRLEDVAGITYRARPFPGDFHVRLRDGTVRVAPFVNHFLSLLAQFTPEECRYCLEKVALSGDIVVGDTWHHPRLCPSLLSGYTQADADRDETIASALRGATMVVVRSERGQAFVDQAMADKRISVNPQQHEGIRIFPVVRTSRGLAKARQNARLTRRPRSGAARPTAAHPRLERT